MPLDALGKSVKGTSFILLWIYRSQRWDRTNYVDKMHIDALAFTNAKDLGTTKGQGGFPGFRGGRTNGTTDFRRYRNCISYGRDSGFYAGSL